MALSKRDRLQVGAFQARFRLLSDVSPDERFLTAICETSDHRFDEAMEKHPELIDQWIERYGRKKNHTRDRQARNG